MEIKELSDYIIYCSTQDAYIIWGTYPDGHQAWALYKKESAAYPMTYAEAEQCIKDLQKEYGDDDKYDICVREKSPAILVKA